VPGWYLVKRILCLRVPSKPDHDPKSSFTPARRCRLGGPLKHPIGPDMCVASCDGEPSVASENATVLTKLEADRSPESHVRVERGRQHGEISSAGQGWAIRRRVATSTFA
jgi:hypothetical protein